MTPEQQIVELLKPRIIVENLYPNCPFQALEIICEPSAQQTEWANTYPYIFRWLAWHEEREEKDMPEYVKGLKYVKRLLKVEYHTDEYPSFLCEGDSVWSPAWLFQPATKKEFEEYESQTKKQ